MNTTVLRTDRGDRRSGAPLGRRVEWAPEERHFLHPVTGEPTKDRRDPAAPADRRNQDELAAQVSAALANVKGRIEQLEEVAFARLLEIEELHRKLESALVLKEAAQERVRDLVKAGDRMGAEVRMLREQLAGFSGHAPDTGGSRTTAVFRLDMRATSEVCVMGTKGCRNPNPKRSHYTCRKPAGMGEVLADAAITEAIELCRRADSFRQGAAQRRDLEEWYGGAAELRAQEEAERRAASR